MDELMFLKLGGSLITDKLSEAAPRLDVMARLAAEIAAARHVRPHLRLLLGHGSGSFGHVTAARYGTRNQVRDDEGWRGFAEVADSAAQLNRLLVRALMAAGVPTLALAPSASALCRDGELQDMATDSVQLALKVGLLPVIYGDVAFDDQRGGTIVSTEEVLAFLTPKFNPSWLLVAGDVPGVLDTSGDVIPEITPVTFARYQSALGHSAGTDVTGGMASKVKSMLAICQSQPLLKARIFAGTQPGLLYRILIGEAGEAGTRIYSDSSL